MMVRYRLLNDDFDADAPLTINPTTIIQAKHPRIDAILARQPRALVK